MIVSLDHGVTFSPIPGIRDIRKKIKSCMKKPVDALDPLINQSKSVDEVVCFLEDSLKKNTIKKGMNNGKEKKSLVQN